MGKFVKYMNPHLIDSLDGNDLVNSDDQFLLYSWEPDFSVSLAGAKQILKQSSKFPKRVVKFVITGVVFLGPKVSSGKEIPINTDSSTLVPYTRNLKSKFFELKLAVISQKTNLFFKKKQNQQLLPFTPPANIISPATNLGKSSPMVVSKRPQSRSLVKRTEALRRRISAANYRYYQSEQTLTPLNKNRNRFALTLQHMKEAVERECGIDFSSVFGGLDSADANALLAEKNARLLYYRYMNIAIIFVSSLALLAVIYSFRHHARKAQKAFDELLLKYFHSRAKHLETSKLHADLFPKWEEMISKYRKALKEKNTKIKQLEETSASEIASLRLVIDMLTNDRDGLLQQLKFIQEHGDCNGNSPGKL